jgi:septation ring formation regulator
MRNLFYLSLGWEIILWGLLGLVGLALIIFLLVKFVFVGRKVKKQFAELNRRIDLARSTLLNKDTQHLRRIESISDVNLLMRPTYDAFYRRFTEIREIDDRRAQKALQTLNEAQIKGAKDFRKIYPEQRAIIQDYEFKVNELDRDLVQVIQPESDSREASVADKEKYRLIKRIYRENKHELELVDFSFNRIFARLEELFKQYDNALNGAYYDEAEQYLHKIRLFLSELEKALEILPLLCVKTSTLIPQKLQQIRQRYEAMEKDNIPLQHLLINQNIEQFEIVIEDVEKRLKQFETQGVDQVLNDIDRKINKIFDCMDYEIEQRDIYLSQFEASYHNVTEMERKYIRLVNMMPKIKEVYFISEEKELELQMIKVSIDNMSNTKRTLDNFIYSSTKQPYSVLVENMRLMQDESNNTEHLIDEYMFFINSLRSDSEKAFSLIKDCFFKFKQAEMLLRDLNVESLNNQLSDKFDRGYKLIDSIYSLISVTPIDVSKVNIDTKELEELSKTLLEYIEKQVSLAHLAENAIIHLNRYRYELSDMQTLGLEVEKLFYAGRFEEAYQKSAQPFTRLKK